MQTTIEVKRQAEWGYKVETKKGRIELYQVDQRGKHYVGWFNTVELALEWVDQMSRSLTAL
jgi:hypothetical protein